MVLSNAGLIPGQSPVYDFFTGYGVLAGTVLILLSVDLASIRVVRLVFDRSGKGEVVVDDVGFSRLPDGYWSARIPMGASSETAGGS